MKTIKTFVVLTMTIFQLSLYGQSVQKFDLTPDNPKLQGQFYVGNYTSENIEEAKFKFLKWLTYFNVGEDIYIEEIEDGRIVFTRIFPQGINMRIMKGAAYDLLGNTDLAVRFVVEFKDSRYRILIDSLGYFIDEFLSNSYLRAAGKFKEYRITFSGEDRAREYAPFEKPEDLPLVYRSPDEIKKAEKKKLDDLLALLNSFLNSTSEFENSFYPETKIVNDSFNISEDVSFPGQSIINDYKVYETTDIEEFTLKTANWFEDNKMELGLNKLYYYDGNIFIFGKRYFNSSSGFLQAVEGLTGASFGELQYFYINIKFNSDIVDFGVNKILRASYTSECGTGLDKTRINQGTHEFIVNKKIYIPSSENESFGGGFKEFEVCPAILVYNESTNFSDLFNKKGKPRKARTKTANDELAFYNYIYQSFNETMIPKVEEDW